MMFNDTTYTPECKGLVFKATVNEYVTPRGIFNKTSLLLQKRKSCSGCEHCGGISELLDESEGDVVGMESVIDGAYYTLDCVTTTWGFAEEDSELHLREIIINIS